jgi:hypothetical protein
MRLDTHFAFDPKSHRQGNVDLSMVSLTRPGGRNPRGFSKLAFCSLLEGVPKTFREQNAMRNATRFAAKFAESIVTTLSCVDRLIFKGHLPLGGDEQLNNQFVDRLGIRRKDFLPQLEPLSERLVEHAKSAAVQEGAPYQYLQGQHSKEKLIDQTIRERKLTSGLIAVLCCLENCRTVKLRYGDGKPRLTFTRRPQRVLYYYFLDSEFGRVHVRIETWFPFTIQIYVNGHDWLARQLAKGRAGFVQQDNCFLELDDPAAAQRQADRFFSLAWKSRLHRWAKQVNPLLKEVPWLRGMQYRWVIDQFEYSTDVLFRSRQHLAEVPWRLGRWTNLRTVRAHSNQ